MMDSQAPLDDSPHEPDIDWLLKNATTSQTKEGIDDTVDPDLVRRFANGQLGHEESRRIAGLVARYSGWFDQYIKEKNRGGDDERRP